MRLNTKRFAWAAGLTMTAVYAVCAAFTAVFPNLAVRFLGWMLHIVNVEKFAGETEMTFGSVVLGWIPVALYGYFSALIFAWLYNRSIKN